MPGCAKNSTDTHPFPRYPPKPYLNFLDCLFRNSIWPDIIYLVSIRLHSEFPLITQFRLSSTFLSDYHSHSFPNIIHASFRLSFTLHSIYHSHSIPFIIHIPFCVSFTFHSVYHSHSILRVSFNSHSIPCIIHTSFHLSFTFHSIYHSHSIPFIIHISFHLSFTFHSVFHLHSIPCIIPIPFRVSFPFHSVYHSLSPVQMAPNIASSSRSTRPAQAVTWSSCWTRTTDEWRQAGACHVITATWGVRWACSTSWIGSAPADDGANTEFQGCVKSSSPSRRISYRTWKHPSSAHKVGDLESFSSFPREKIVHVLYHSLVVHRTTFCLGACLGSM